jgi:PTH1 family peptidyl-tRNA hydrolase
MKVIVGLGNPESKYDGTRHNIGFAVVDTLHSKLQVTGDWKAGKGEYYFAKGSVGNEDVLLIKPTTYMNLSGRAVRDVLTYYKISISDLLIVTDDIAIPLGSLRIRKQGSDGGHNGLTSIILELGTNQFNRLRFGIGSDFAKGQQSKFVLTKFKPTEKELVDIAIERAIEGIYIWLTQGIDAAMNVINIKESA